MACALRRLLALNLISYGMNGDDGSDIDNAASVTSILGDVFLPVCVAIALGRLRRVDCLPLISDLCLIAALRSRPVTDHLDAAVGEIDPVRALQVASVVLFLVFVKACARVDVFHTVLVDVRLRGQGVLLVIVER